MTAMTDIKKGDRVRVVIEDTVDRVDYFDGTVYLANAHDWENESWFHEDEPTVVSFEKVEPPVEVFGPGDVVRDRRTPEWLYLLTKNGGYVELDTGIAYLKTNTDGFTSERYEKVELVPKPF